MLRNINATSVFFDLYQLLQICDENDIFIVYFPYCCHACMPYLQYSFLCTGMHCFTYQIERKSPVSMNGLTGLFFV